MNCTMFDSNQIKQPFLFQKDELLAILNYMFKYNKHNNWFLSPQKSMEISISNVFSASSYIHNTFREYKQMKQIINHATFE